MQHYLQNEFLQATFKEAGAELCSLRRKDTGLEYIWGGNPDIWGRHAPVLFPIVGKLRANQYQHNGKSYSLPQHGFGRDRRWEVVHKTATELSFILTDDAESRQDYPFSFRFTLGYRLAGDALHTSYQIHNSGEDSLLFSVGGHPAFVCPLKKEEQFSDYSLHFSEKEKQERELLEHGLRNGRFEPVLKDEKVLPLNHNLFNKDALIFKNMASDCVRLQSKNHAHGTEICFKGFPYLGIWSKAGDAPFVSIEPWYGVSDKRNAEGVLGKKEGIQQLESGKEFMASYRIRVF